jgi:signal transduction histidine kinase/ligand-binding sensor domain-containing protein/DNA-binding response OmpR family regulator
VYCSPCHAGDNYKFRTLSPEGGFYFDGIIAVQQNKDGFVWVLMDHDLFRFDGYQYKQYYTCFTSLDKSVEWIFYGMASDSSGRLFVNTNNGLYAYDKNSDAFEKIFENVDNVKIDNRDNVWIKYEKNWSILNLNDNTLTTPLYDGKSLSYIGLVFCTNDNDLYTFSNYRRIYRYNYEKNEFSFCFSIPDNKDGRILAAKAYKGKLWILVQKYGLYKINLATFAIENHYDFFKDNNAADARTLYIDKRGHAWIGTIGGLYVLDPESGEYSRFVHSKSDPFSLPNNSIWTITEDMQKNIWIGTYSGALCYVNPDEKMPFKTYAPQSNRLNHIPVSAFAEDKRSLWIGTEGGGINRLDKATGEFSYYTSKVKGDGLAYNNIKSIVVDKDQNLWIGMFNGGIDFFDVKANRFKNFKNIPGQNSLLDNSIRKMVLEADSGIWIAYQRKQLTISYYSFKDKRFTHYDLKKDNRDQYIFDILRGQGDQLWLASNEKLYMMDARTFAVKEIQQTDSVFMNFSAICMDHSGNLWIGAIGNGLIKYNPNTSEFKIFDNVLKYDVSSIHSISCDDEGYLWLGTDNGLLRYNIAGNVYSIYDKKDGVQGPVYYPLASMKGLNGELYFGGTNGFTIIDPKEITQNTYKPQVIISDFYIDHEPSNPDLYSAGMPNEIVLDYDQANFGFKFSSDNYLIPEKSLFKYRLKGYDDRWIEVDASERTALYSKVPSGTYYFEVLAANNDGVWGDAPSTIKIIRKPAPWFSLPAYILYSILVLAAGYTVFRYYNEKKRLKMQLYLENLEKDKKDQIHKAQLKFFTNISHDFRTPLSLILAAIDRLRQEGMKEHYCRILNGNARRLLNLVNELMDFGTVENGKMKLAIEQTDINAFIKRIASDFSDYALQRNIDFKVAGEPSLSRVYIDRHVVEKIVMNLLNNAFKYTKDGGAISIGIVSGAVPFMSQYENSYTVEGKTPPRNTFSIAVRDTGLGISEESIASVFERFYKVNTVNADSCPGTGIGLALVKSLVLLHKGAITVYSAKDKGTDMVVRLPLDKSAYEETDFLEKEETVIEGDDKRQEKIELEEDILLRDRKRILLSEDNDDLRSLIAGSLSDDYEIVEASDGMAATGLIESMDMDLVISDIMMPLKDGITLCHEMKNDINTSHIPFILLTAKTGIESKIEGADSGADMYFEKPVDLDFLKLSIQNIFRRQRQLKEYYAKNHFADSAELSSNEHDNKFLKKFIEIIDANMDQSGMDVNYIATELSMSRSKLYTKIKTLTDKSIVEFILSYRMRKAARLIIEEDMTMREVMTLIGIESQPYFTNAFKKEFGETPTAFASKHRKNKEK